MRPDKLMVDTLIEYWHSKNMPANLQICRTLDVLKTFKDSMYTLNNDELAEAINVAYECGNIHSISSYHRSTEDRVQLMQTHLKELLEVQMQRARAGNVIYSVNNGVNVR